MKTSVRLVAAIVAVIALVTSSCSKKPSTDRALDEAVKALTQTNAPAVAQTAAPATANPIVATPVTQQMTQAVTSYKNGNYVDAVARLQWLRARKGNTPEQIMALQEAMAAVMGEIYARAARGDAGAQKAVKEYERMQTAP